MIVLSRFVFFFALIVNAEFCVDSFPNKQAKINFSFETFVKGQKRKNVTCSWGYRKEMIKRSFLLRSRASLPSKERNEEWLIEKKSQSIENSFRTSEKSYIFMISLITGDKSFSILSVAYSFCCNFIIFQILSYSCKFSNICYLYISNYFWIDSNAQVHENH